MNLSENKIQQFIASLIDEAVDCWHKVADEHEIAHCNCFREAFAQSLINQGVFVGYTKIKEDERKLVDAAYTDLAGLLR